MIEIEGFHLNTHVIWLRYREMHTHLFRYVCEAVSKSVQGLTVSTILYVVEKNHSSNVVVNNKSHYPTIEFNISLPKVSVLSPQQKTLLPK